MTSHGPATAPRTLQVCRSVTTMARPGIPDQQCPPGEDLSDVSGVRDRDKEALSKCDWLSLLCLSAQPEGSVWGDTWLLIIARSKDSRPTHLERLGAVEDSWRANGVDALDEPQLDRT